MPVRPGFQDAHLPDPGGPESTSEGGWPVRIEPSAHS